MHSPLRPSRGFTLLELVVVIVVLAVLAAIAVPTFARVIDRSHDETTIASLSSYARGVQALSAFEQSGLDRRHFEDAARDLDGFAAGIFAALPQLEGGVELEGNVKAVPGVLSYSYTSDRSRGAAAALSPSGACVAIRFDASSVEAVDMPSDVERCTGYNALHVEDEPLLGVEPGEPEIPASPSGLKGSGAAGRANLSWSPVLGATSYELLRGEEVVLETSSHTAALEQAYGSTVSYRVRALNRSGTGPLSAPVAVTHVPVAPEISSVKMVDSDAEIIWSAVDGAALYNVYLDGSDTVVATVNAPTSTVSVPVPAGQRAVFVVRAGNIGGLSDGSAPVGVTATPAAPVNVVAVLDDDRVTVSWDAVPGADLGYDVYYTTGTMIRNVDVTSTTVPLGFGESAAFVVEAKNAAGNSAASAPSNTVTRAPAAPEDATASLSGNTATVSWSKVTPSTGYEVLYAGSWKAISGTTTTYTLSPGEQTSFTVRAVSGTVPGPGAVTNVVTNAPSAPSDLAADVRGTSVSLSWAASAGADGYYVYRDGALLGEEDVASFGTVQDAGTVASYRVAAHNTGGTSDPSAALTVTTAPSAPTGVRATAWDDRYVDLAWDAALGTSWHVYRDGVRLTSSALTTSSYRVSGLTNGTTHSFQISAVKNALEGEKSAPVSAAASTYAAAVRADNPYYWWRFDDASARLKDSSGNNRHASTFGGTPLFGTSSGLGSGEGSSFSFNGGDSFMMSEQAGNQDALTSSNPVNNFTIEAWVKPSVAHEIDAQGTNTDSNGNGVVRSFAGQDQNYLFWPKNGGDTSKYGVGVSVGTNGISVYEHTGGYLQAGLVWEGIVPSDRWTHMVVVQNGKQSVLYVNGALVKTGRTATQPGSVLAPTGSSHHYGGGYVGAADELAVYAKSFTAAQVLAHYNAGR